MLCLEPFRARPAPPPRRDHKHSSSRTLAGAGLVPALPALSRADCKNAVAGSGAGGAGSGAA